MASSSAKTKHQLMWATYGLAWSLGATVVLLMLYRAGWLTIVAFAVAFAIACGGASHTHEMHLADPLREPEPERFRKPDGPRRD
ncbi:MAG: hypothetical protein JWO67_4527 [Streptosporangiaceae bacterium]|nr:hypothetical protein [Streptosporangiaceae bacterium]